MKVSGGLKAIQEWRDRQHQQKLQWELNAARTNLKAAEKQISDLKMQLAAKIQEQAIKDLTQSPAERVMLDIIKNYGRPPNGRRYCIDTLAWTEEIHASSAHTLEIVRKVIPLPTERLLNSKFTQDRRLVSDALQNSDRIGELITIWEKSTPSISSSHRDVILSVDAVAFRPLVTVSEDGEVHGLKNLTRLEDPDIFAHFLRDPPAFAHFLQTHWKQAYSNLFAFHLQPVDPDLPCCVIHVYPARNGKGNPETVRKLLELRDKLETQFGFKVRGLAFDGDSCWNGLHDAFADEWKTLLVNSPQGAFPTLLTVARLLLDRVVICDPLHLLKRIRYRLLQLIQLCSPQEHLQFCLSVIQEAHILSPVVFDNSHESKMHDSLPLELFSLKTLGYILYHPVVGETMMVPWCLLVVALTSDDLSTEARLEILEVGFWVLFLYEYPDVIPEPPNNSAVPLLRPKRCGDDKHSLYTDWQFRDALNTFMSLIILIDVSWYTFCLNRFGSNPLEHAFGHARIRCRDVNSMMRLIAGLSGDYSKIAIESFLSIAAAPNRRRSVGAVCKPLVDGEARFFSLPPQLIARSLLIRSANPVDVLDRFDPPPLVITAWNELKKIPGVEPAFPEPSTVPSTPRRVTRLSSNRIFLGFAKSPRPIHLITSSQTLGRALGNASPPTGRQTASPSQGRQRGRPKKRTEDEEDPDPRHISPLL
jgi:hypothetical protein